MLQRQSESNTGIWCWNPTSLENPEAWPTRREEPEKVRRPEKKNESESPKSRKNEVELPQIPNNPKIIVVYIYMSAMKNEIRCWGEDDFETPGRLTPGDDEVRKVTIPTEKDQSEPAKERQNKIDLPQIPNNPKTVIVYVYAGSMTN